MVSAPGRSSEIASITMNLGVWLHADQTHRFPGLVAFLSVVSVVDGTGVRLRAASLELATDLDSGMITGWLPFPADGLLLE